MVRYMHKIYGYIQDIRHTLVRDIPRQQYMRISGAPVSNLQYKSPSVFKCDKSVVSAAQPQSDFHIFCTGDHCDQFIWLFSVNQIQIAQLTEIIGKAYFVGAASSFRFTFC